MLVLVWNGICGSVGAFGFNTDCATKIITDNNLRKTGHSSLPGSP